MSEKFAPIVVFAFNRPSHLGKTLDALAKCPESGSCYLRIYCDGPRDQRDAVEVEATRRIAQQESRFNRSEVVISEKNNGLAKAIIHGVTETIAEFGRVIVLEDDILVAPSFLTYMNAALDFYSSDESLACISGYQYPIDPTGLPTEFFMRGTDCWGWATWERSWRIFEANGEKLLKQIYDRGLSWEFDLDGCYPYTQMLRDQVSGSNNSWAIRWHASAYLAGKFCLVPTVSLVENIGFDGTGTHCDDSTRFNALKAPGACLPELTMEAKESSLGRMRIAKFLLKTQAPGYKIRHKIRQITRRFFERVGK